MKDKLVNSDFIIFQKNYYDVMDSTEFAPIVTDNFMVMQVGDSFYLKSLEQPIHMQLFDLELTVPVRNTAFTCAGEVTTKLEKNDVFLSFKDELHQVKSRNNFRFQYIAFDVRKNSPLYPLFTEIKKRFNEPDKRVVNIAEISPIITDILIALSKEDYKFPLLYVDNKIVDILFRIYNYTEKQDGYNLFTKQDLLPNITNYIDGNFAKINSLTEVSDKFGYSYNYISKVFKQIHGVTLQQYLISKKMEYAALLLKKNSSIEDVSVSLNYSSVYNFSRAFKIYHKVSPGTYRSKYGTAST